MKTEPSGWNPLLYFDGVAWGAVGYVVTSHLPIFLFFLKALLFRFGYLAAAVRWFVVGPCFVSFTLGAIVKDDAPPANNAASTTAIGSALESVCPGQNLGHIDTTLVEPVSGYLTVRLQRRGRA